MADQTLAKHINELRVLTLLRSEGETTRAEIARRLQLTPATITRLVNSLAERKLVREGRNDIATARREPGRPGVTVMLDPDGAFFLGVEIGVGHMRFALIDLKANVTSADEIKTSRSITPKRAVAIITEQLGKLSRERRFRHKIKGIGITVPGLVNNDSHVVHLPALGWKNVNLLGLLQTVGKMPMFVENNANAAAFGAAYTHPSKSESCSLFLKLGTGCGGAAIVNGRLLRGAHGMAGEFGHIRIADHGPRCYCGQTGCLETFVNLQALARNYYGSEDAMEDDIDNLPAEVALEATSGNAHAHATLDRLCDDLSRGMASLINTFNPATIFLGGTMRPVLAVNLDEIRRKVAEAIVPGMTVPVIRMSMHENLECAVGAATIAHRGMFNVPWVETMNPIATSAL